MAAIGRATRCLAAAALALSVASCCRRDQVTTDPSPAGAASSSAGAARKALLPVGPLGSSSASPVAAVVAPHPVWLVHNEAGYTGISLGPGDERWASGPPELIGDASSVSAMRRPVDAAKAPATASGVVGQTVSIRSTGGQPCQGRAKGLSLFGPLYSEQSEKLGKALQLLAGQGPKSGPAAAKLAAGAWKHGDEKPALVADLEVDSGCSGLWAQPTSAPEAQIVAFVEAEGALEAAALRALKALPISARIQAHYAKVKKPGEPALWSELPEYNQGATVARDVAGQSLVHTVVSACRGYGVFTVNLEVFWLVSGPPDAPQLALYSEARASEERWVDAAADLNHDGKVDVITLDGFALGSDKGLGPIQQTRGREVYMCPGAGASASNFN